ncbi:preprotein translocase, YajC subunit, yajC [Pediococcus stilesii]|uniref:Preprotein translocase, YajC subunit, yajC n=1 Tax=Pediococcus stilesii TaxID=331679 RepID=A0A5R9BU51_9LACO|nr:preprotein translocase, YajC subunit, yajC [Pediococcus stilesii]TLQ03521.1 preprotein translocase, YajC subunit, yajC [Pediococcus stilesii]
MAEKEIKEEKKPFDVGDEVVVKKTDLLPTGFEGTVGKVYENSILVEIDPASVADSRSEELHDLHGRVVVRMSEAKKK